MTGAEKRDIEKSHCFCPYCDSELEEESPMFCQACRVVIFYCPRCRKPVSREDDTCPHCGAEIKGKK